ncbi:MAG: NUDIX domain-containing protein, partial [Hyphomicrobiales bacterium]|nr:NUDIX domain-containing protein [Hyphomicrobiales bacterium]
MTESAPPERALRPRDAATLILVDGSERGTARVLMGKRHPGHKFMPGKFVFPGGAVDPEDSRMAVAGPLDSRVADKLLTQTRRRSQDYARALALAALRETFEETGLALGVTDLGAPPEPP